jgi:hypothetical protein
MFPTIDMASKNSELALECKRQSESCLYTSTSLFIWLRFLRITKAVFIVVPLVLGSIAGWQVLRETHAPWVKALTSIAAFLAGLLPTVYSALKFDDHLEQCKHLTAEFKNLRDSFRQAALVSALKPFAEFEKDFQPLMRRLEQARSISYTAPEWCFKKAQEKVHKGDYDFDVDLKELDKITS